MFLFFFWWKWTHIHTCLDTMASTTSCASYWPFSVKGDQASAKELHMCLTLNPKFIAPFIRVMCATASLKYLLKSLLKAKHIFPLFTGAAGQVRVRVTKSHHNSEKSMLSWSTNQSISQSVNHSMHFSCLQSCTLLVNLIHCWLGRSTLCQIEARAMCKQLTTSQALYTIFHGKSLGGVAVWTKQSISDYM